MGTSSALSTDNQYIKYKITITQNSQSAINNTSDVTVSVKFYRTNTGYTTYGTGTVYCTIDGTQYTAAVTSSQKITSSGIVLFSKKLTVKHGSDGTKTLKVSSYIKHSQFNSSSQSYSQTLTAIAKATKPTLSSASVAVGGTVTINLPRANSAYTHTLKYSIGSKSNVSITTGAGTSYSWKVPDAIATEIGNNTYGTVTISCITYYNGTALGTEKVSLKITIPNTYVPTISSITCKEIGETIPENFGAFIQNKSEIEITVNASSTGSSITSYQIVVDDKTVNSKTATFFPRKSGTYAIKATVKDARGKSATLTKNIQVYQYSLPAVELLAYRCDKNGNRAEEGLYYAVEYSYAITDVNSKNSKSFTLQAKTSTDENYSTILTGSTYTATSKYVSTRTFDINTSLQVRGIAKDSIRTTTVTSEVETGKSIMNFPAHGRGIAFGKVAELEDVADFAYKVKCRNGLTANAGAWTNLEIDSNFKNYSDDSANQPKVRGVGGVVEVRGMLTPTSKITGSYDTLLMATGIPEELRPPYNSYYVCQGSGMNRWLLYVTTGGNLYFSRYGTNTLSDAEPGYWLPFAVTYTI